MLDFCNQFEEEEGSRSSLWMRIKLPLFAFVRSPFRSILAKWFLRWFLLRPFARLLWLLFFWVLFGFVALFHDFSPRLYDCFKGIQLCFYFKHPPFDY